MELWADAKLRLGFKWFLLSKTLSEERRSGCCPWASLEFFNTHSIRCSSYHRCNPCSWRRKGQWYRNWWRSYSRWWNRYDGTSGRYGDPVFWFTVRPFLVPSVLHLHLIWKHCGPTSSSSLVGIIRMAFLWYTQEFGYKAGSKSLKTCQGGILKDITKGASILGMFILAVLVQRWVSINFTTVIFQAKTIIRGAYVVFPGRINCL